MLDATQPAPRAIVVVDTEEYSGNFEREMVAWMTGQIGECGVGSRIIEASRLDMSASLRSFCDHHIVRLPDDREYPCRRPASIWPTPGWFNDGSGNLHRDDADLAVVQSAWEASREERREHVRQIWSHDPDYAERTIREKDATFTEPGRWPAYLSVAAFFNEVPSDEMLAELTERARFFSAEYHKGGELEGLRMARFRESTIPITGLRLLTPEQGALLSDVLTQSSFAL